MFCQKYISFLLYKIYKFIISVDPLDLLGMFYSFFRFCDGHMFIAFLDILSNNIIVVASSILLELMKKISSVCIKLTMIKIQEDDVPDLTHNFYLKWFFLQQNS